MIRRGKGGHIKVLSPQNGTSFDKWGNGCMEALGTYYKIQPLLIFFVQFLNMPLISSYNTLNLLQKSKLYNKMCLILSHSKSVGLEKQKQKISDLVI